MSYFPDLFSFTADNYFDFYPYIDDFRKEKGSVSCNTQFLKLDRFMNKKETNYNQIMPKKHFILQHNLPTLNFDGKW